MHNFLRFLCGFKFAAIIFLLVLNCYHFTKYIPSPEKDIEKWVRNFEQQKSFKYQYQIKTKLVYTKGSGGCMIGKGEHVQGMWAYSDSSITFEYIGLGDSEYAKKNSAWQESPRGEESDIFAQIKRFLTFDKFEYLGYQDGFLYRFKANIPFLAPDRWKEMTGLIKISKKNYLPALIWAGLPDSSVYWQAEIFSYNTGTTIKSPVKNWRSYMVIADSTWGEKNDLLKAIKKRLDLLGADYQLKETNQGIFLKMNKAYGIEDIETMLARVKINAYGVAKNKQEAIKIGYLKNNLNVPLFLTDKIFDHDDIKAAQIKFDAVSKPIIWLILSRKINLPSEIAIEIDGVIVAIAGLDIPKKIDKITFYPDMEYYKLEILRACLSQTLPVVKLKSIIEESY